jgi:superfamily II DNA or RNA helicase
VELTLTDNKQFLRVDEASEMEVEQLNITLNRRIESWRFHPLVKKGLWDGYISYIKDDKWIPSGLWREVMNMCKQYKYELKLNGITRLFDTNIKAADFEAWAMDFFDGSEIQPRDYQIEAAYNILKFRNCLSELATSAGKTLISFMVISYLLEKQKAGRILFIVPNVSLVVQGSEDFQDYNWRNQANIKVQQIYSGQKIRPGRNVVIGTYQSLVKKDKEYFQQFDAVLIDETHKAKSQSIKTILQKCTAANYRFGLSGTIPKAGSLDRLTLMAYTGPVITEVSANFLQEEGHIAGCKVKVIKMDYAAESTKNAFREMSQNRYESKDVYKFESNYVIQSPGRLAFICSIISRVKGNGLVLFHRIEHGKKIYEKLRQESEKNVYYVDGNTDKDIREEYKKKMEAGAEIIIVASYGTFSTGISINKIHNIFFTESFKSEVIIRQSIGRGLRKHKSKTDVNIIDFVDDLSSPDWDNYLIRHAKARQKIYREQKFPFEVKNVTFEGDI